MKNVEKAVAVIAVLSLLLGLSLGQNHRQYLKLKALESASFAPVVEIHPHPAHHRFGCEVQNELISAKMAGLRARLEAKRMELEEQRRRLEASELNRLRFEIKDPENGSNTIIRIVREE